MKIQMTIEEKCLLYSILESVQRRLIFQDDHYTLQDDKMLLDLEPNKKPVFDALLKKLTPGGHDIPQMSASLAESAGYHDALHKAEPIDEQFASDDEKNAYWKGYHEGEDDLKEQYNLEQQQQREGILSA
jgi:hypothetical protein